MLHFRVVGGGMAVKSKHHPSQREPEMQRPMAMLAEPFDDANALRRKLLECPIHTHKQTGAFVPDPGNRSCSQSQPVSHSLSNGTVV
ncbi:alcohol dehydrogenase cytochrome c subunit precursor [Anopheles sinensis]|uniref:Alcohol dehydrogenase cytochrome c subunit n=1 Tax=Anopheles sinensis TaxID=74873 RepID=A0A084VLK8_ANOSI|nr:alcohol dehydrogenase cytochrome c subunit precursor [Anopheles sinensis]